MTHMMHGGSFFPDRWKEQAVNLRHLSEIPYHHWPQLNERSAIFGTPSHINLLPFNIIAQSPHFLIFWLVWFGSTHGKSHTQGLKQTMHFNGNCHCYCTVHGKLVVKHSYCRPKPCYATLSVFKTGELKQCCTIDNINYEISVIILTIYLDHCYQIYQQHICHCFVEPYLQCDT